MEHRILYSFVTYIVVVLLCTTTTSCITKKDVVKDEKETTETKVDSVIIETIKQDTTNVAHKTNIRETEKVETETNIEKHDSTIMMVDVNGNVIKQEIWHKENKVTSRNREYEKRLLDSLAYYRLMVDSLRQYQAKNDTIKETVNHQQTKVVTKTVIPWFFKLSMVVFIICCIFALIKLIKYGTKYIRTKYHVPNI